MKKILFILYIFIFINSYSKPINENKTENINNSVQRDHLNFDDVFFKALNEIKNEDFKKAQNYLEQAIKLNDTIGVVYFELSKIYYKNNNIDNAVKYVLKAINLDPKNIWYKYQYAMYLLELYKLNEAEATLLSILNEFSNKINVLQILINIADENNDYVKFIEYINKLENHVGISKETSFAKKNIYIKNGEIENAIFEMEKLIKYFPSNIEYYLEILRIYNANDLLIERDSLLNIIENKAKNNFVYKFLLVNYYDDTNQKDKFIPLANELILSNQLDLDNKLICLEKYMRYIQSDTTLIYGLTNSIEELKKKYPNEYEVFKISGYFNVYKNKLDSAIKDLDKVIELNKTDFNIWIELIRLYIDYNKPEQAINSGEKTINYFPTQPLAYYLTSFAYFKAKLYEKSIKICLEGLDFVFDDDNLKKEFYVQLGNIYYEKKVFDSVYLYLRKALEINPEDPVILNNYAYFLAVNNKDLEFAKRMSLKSNIYSPNNGTFEDTYAWILYKLNQFEEAEIWIRKAIKNSPKENGVMYEHMGDILIKLNKIEEALFYWNRCIEMKDEETGTVAQKIKKYKIIEK